MSWTMTNDLSPAAVSTGTLSRHILGLLPREFHEIQLPDERLACESSSLYLLPKQHKQVWLNPKARFLYFTPCAGQQFADANLPES